MLKRACSLFFFFIVLAATLPSAAAVTHLYDDYCTGADCILYLPMDEGAGAYANDTSQYGNNGTLNGTTWGGGYSVTGLEFDGVNDSVNITTFTNLTVSDITLSAWINTASASNQMIISQGEAPYTFYAFVTSGGAIRCAFDSTTQGAKSLDGSTVNDGEWHRIDCVYNGTNMLLYLDGVEDARTTYTGVLDVGRNFAEIGQRSPTGLFMNGTIDEVQIYNRSLTPAEILEQYQIKFLAITAKDEDTNNTITGEELTIITTNATDLTTIDTQTTTTGEVIFSVNTTADLIISAYTNDTYENQRRHLYYYAALTGRTDTTIYLLEDGRGISQPIQVFDRVTYQTIQGAAVQINLSGNIIDYGITDSGGRVNSYLDVYKLYTIQATKPGEYAPGSIESITPTSETYDIYLTALGERPPLIRATFNPSQEFLNPNKTYIPMVTIHEYTQAPAMSFIIAAGPKYLEYYQSTGTEYTGLVTHETFNFTSTGEWCNSTYICSIAENNASITFRYSQAYLGAYGNSIRVTYNWSEGGQEKIDSKGYLFTDFKGNFADQFTDTQKLWVGFAIVFFGLFIVTKELVKNNYNPSIKSLGFIAWLLMLTSYKLQFFPESFAVVGTLLYIGGVFAGRIL